MEVELEFGPEKYLRILEKKEIMLVLNNDQLEIKLFEKNQSEFYYKGVFNFSTITHPFNSIFKNMREIYKELKSVREDLLTFSEAYELKYTLNLTTKQL